MLKILWRPEASGDLETIVEYVAQHSAQAADDLEVRIRNAVENAARYPNLYKQALVAGLREAIAHPNYRVLYRVHGEAIEVVAVLHARREYP